MNGENICETIRELILLNQKEIYRSTTVSEQIRNELTRCACTAICHVGTRYLIRRGAEVNDSMIECDSKVFRRNFYERNERRDSIHSHPTKKKRFTCCSAHILNPPTHNIQYFCSLILLLLKYCVRKIV